LGCDDLALGIAMKAGYPQAIETTNQSARIRF
jgi:hypothetical protein